MPEPERAEAGCGVKGGTVSKPTAGVKTGLERSVPFEPNDFYERLLRDRAADRTRFELSYSLVTKRSVEAYERAKAKHLARGRKS